MQTNQEELGNTTKLRLGADRGKDKIKKDYTLRSFVKWYKKETKSKLTNKQIIDFFIGTEEDPGIYLEMRDRAINKAQQITFFGYSYIDIRIIRPKRWLNYKDEVRSNNDRLTDYKATALLYQQDPTAKEKGLRIIHENKHTHGKRMRIRWQKAGLKKKNVGLYKFRASREFQRAVVEAINANPHIEFFEDWR